MAQPSAFESPVPGNSLTLEPGNAPWENPPKYSTPVEALEFYMKKLGDEELQEELFDMLEKGIPISVVTDTLTSQGVMDGIHSVDVKLILKPTIALHLVSLADIVGIDYKMAMSDYQDKDLAAKTKRQIKLAKILEAKALMGDKSDPGVQLEGQVAEFLQEEPQADVAEETAPEVEEEITPEVATQAPMGLMAKGV